MIPSQQIVAIANGYADANITEIHPNNGWTDKDYEAKMKTVGWEPGFEWCAAAAILDWKIAYADYPEIWAIIKKHVSLNSQDMARNFHADPVWPTSADVPKVGAIVVWASGDSTTRGHAGIVVAVNGNQFTSVEGNTTSGTRPNTEAGMSEREGWTIAPHVHAVGLPHSSLKLNLVRFIYAIQSYDPLVIE